MARLDEQINVRVSSEMKEKWENYVEESEKERTIPELVRNAVYLYIDQKGVNMTAAINDLTGDGTGATEASNDQLDSIKGELHNLTVTVREIERTLERVEAATAMEPDPNYDVLDVLPPAKPYTDDAKIARDRAVKEVGETIIWSGKPENIAEYLDRPSDPDTAEEVVERLDLVTDTEDVGVESAVIDGDRRFWYPRSVGNMDAIKKARAIRNDHGEVN